MMNVNDYEMVELNDDMLDVVSGGVETDQDGVPLTPERKKLRKQIRKDANFAISILKLLGFC